MAFIRRGSQWATSSGTRGTLAARNDATSRSVAGAGSGMAKPKHDQLQKELDRQRRAVDTDRFDITVRELVRMAATDELHRAPEYQRKFRWDEVRESSLIESLFLGLPVPSLYVATNPDGKWEVVDGLQRITTLMHYVADPLDILERIGRDAALVLTGLEKLSSFNGTTFAALPLPLRLQFYKRSLPVTALSDKADPTIRFDLFERLNRGGLPLTAHEVRACVYQGQFNEFLRDLAENESYQGLLKLQAGQEDDGTSEEIVLKFFAYLNNRDKFKGAVTSFLNDYMGESSKGFDYDTGRALFEGTVEALAERVDGPVLRDRVYVTPINQLEAILVGCAEVLQAGETLARPPQGWLNDEELVAYSTKGTNTPASLNGRIARARTLLTAPVKRAPRRTKKTKRRTKKKSTKKKGR